MLKIHINGYEESNKLVELDIYYDLRQKIFSNVKHCPKCSYYNSIFSEYDNWWLCAEKDIISFEINLGKYWNNTIIGNRCNIDFIKLMDKNIDFGCTLMLQIYKINGTKITNQILKCMYEPQYKLCRKLLLKKIESNLSTKMVLDTK